MIFASELYVDGFGSHVEVHERNDDCMEHGCCIHNPSDHHMRDWPTLWRNDRGIMERICEHGVGHPDPDGIAYMLRVSESSGEPFPIADGIHGCDGCCRRERAA